MRPKYDRAAEQSHAFTIFRILRRVEFWPFS